MRAHKRDRRDRSWTRPWIATAIAASSLTCTYTLHHDTQGDDSSSSDTEDVEHTYEATVRRTTHGVAHVLADDYGSAGFGLGYAFAEDHLCTLADQVIKVRSQRARYLGPGALSANINSDFAHLALDVMGTADAMLASTADVDALAVIEGYTAGYNKYLDEVGRDGVGGWCQGAEWLVPIEPRDVAAYALTLGMVASGTQLIDFIATAQPPGSADAVPGPPLSRLSTRDTGIGSNGWALGKERTASGRGMVLANPHFPWEGELRLWESHVTIPDELNIYGVSLLGVPAINIGFNEDVAWTHTFSQEGQRMIIYMLDLVPGDPTRYYYGDEERAMSSQTYTIDVRQPDGGLAPKALTMYFSHYGPIINPLGYGWSETQAVTYRDANVHNDALISQFMGMNRARSLAEFKQVFSEVQGMPWAHTMAADREGDAWYIDAAATPNLSAQAINNWQASIEDPGLPALIYENAGVMVLNGSDPENDWIEVPGAREPGLVPVADVPQLDRADFVFNANDTHWLANPAAPLEGYPKTHGVDRVPQSLRTRTNVWALTTTGPGSPSGEDGRFTVEELGDTVLSNQSIAVELLRDAVVARCQGVTTVEVDGATVDISEACSLLAAWDGALNPDSVGALVWREFMGAFAARHRVDKGYLFAVAFDPDDPIATPHTLPPPPEEGEVDQVLKHLAIGVRTLGEAGLPLDAPVSAAQKGVRGSDTIPIHGGAHAEGVMNQVFYSVLKTSLDPDTPQGEVINATTDLTEDGYIINYGSSFIMSMEYTDDGPRGQAVLTYGQSEDPASPHYTDQMQRFSQKQWRAIAFTEEQIAADRIDEYTITLD